MLPMPHESLSATRSGPLFAVPLGVIAAWLVFAAIWLICAWHAVHGKKVVSDEFFHAPQIFRFLHGQFDHVDPGITNIPGYHLLVAGLLKLFGSQGSLGAIRAVNALFGLLAAGAFLFARRGGGAGNDWRATAQFLFLPVLFVYGFLAYTDMLSVALILLATGFTLRQRHVAASGMLVAAMLVRQNDVIWAGFLALLSVWPPWRESGWKAWRAIPEMLLMAWPYLVTVLIFIGYWAWNGSISYSAVEQSVHPDVSFHLGNPYFFLFLVGIFHPLQYADGLRRAAAAVRVQPWRLLFPVAVFAAYVAGFAVTNPFDLVATDHFLHNAVLAAVNRGGPVWWAFGLIAVVAACGIAGTRFDRPQYWLMFPFALFYLATSWLIEGRYSLIPLALWLVLRRQESNLCERLTLALWVPVAVYFLFGVIDGRFIL